MFEESRIVRCKVGKEGENKIWILDFDNYFIYRESRSINFFLIGEVIEI